MQRGSRLSAIVSPSANLRRQVPAFALVGAFGFVVDSGLTYALVRGFGADPFVARVPAFAVATVFNFLLNRSLTFAGSRAPWLAAFVRYCLVCAAGLAVNWSVYAAALALVQGAGYRPTPEMLPIFVAFGTGIAMFVTFFGFKRFAFKV
jgi:putative flippase GtrA